MVDLIENVKESMGYTTSRKACYNCDSFKEDMTTDNFGPGDLCVRNPDYSFNANREAICDRWEKSND